LVYIINDSGSKILYVQEEANLHKALQAWEEMPNLEYIIMMQDDYRSDDPRVLDLAGVRQLGVKLLVQYPVAYEKHAGGQWIYMTV
jgi:long-chain acyl-CoA synthetase